MAQKKNKVKFGLNNAHYAKATVAEDGSVTFDKPKRMRGAVNISLSQEGSTDKFYADDGVYYTSSTNNGYDGDAEFALIPEEFLTEILKQVQDENGVILENANVEPEQFAFLFEFKGDVHKVRHVLYLCTAARPDVEGETREDSTTPKTEKINITSVPMANGLVKCKTGSATSKEVYDKWYDEVYVPTITGSEETTGEGKTQEDS